MLRRHATAGAQNAGRTAGFSLIELSIVIVIFSTVAVMGLEVAAKLLSRRAYTTTQAQLTALDNAMVQFYRVYGRLPCPADRTRLITDTAYGTEDCSLAAASGVVKGTVPFRTMNLPVSATIDGYGSRINYIVTQNFMTAANFIPANTAQIEVRSGTLQQPCSSTCSVQASTATDTGAAYFLFSSGEDKRGAIAAYGNAAVACYSATSDPRIDSQNCANGALTVGIATNVYYDSRFNNGTQTSNYFDDIVIWRTRGRMM